MTTESNAMHLRQATADDSPTILRLVNAAFAVERFFVDADRLDSGDLPRLFESGRFLLLEDGGGRAAGCVYYEIRGERGYFGLLSVDPAQHRGGFGRRLIAAVEEACRAAGCVAVDIRVVNLRTELPPIYRRLGYADAGTEPYPASGATKLPCHFLRMTKPLV